MNPNQAQAELARRELARRELAKRSSSNQQVIDNSAKFGGMSKTPNALERIGTNLTDPHTKPLGMTGIAGIVSSAAGIPEEDMLPAIGQGVGGMASGFTGAGLLGATVGATTGQGIRQLLKKLRGEPSNFGDMGREALTTGAIEGATRGAGSLIFRRQIANEALGKLSKELGGMKEAMSKDPNLKAPIYDVYHNMSNSMNSLPEPMQTGSVANKLKQWLKFMGPKNEMSAKDLIHMEGDLGQAAKYGKIEKGAYMPATELPNPAANKIAKDSRSDVSNIVDQLAQASGQKNWKSVSQKISKLLKNPDKTDVTKTTGNVFGQLAAGGAIGGITQNPIAGLATFSAMRALQSPETRNLVFRGLRSRVGKSATTGTKLTLAELARRSK